MTKKKKQPLSPMTALTKLGVELEAITDSQARGDCPFCGGGDKFHIRYAGFEDKSGGKRSVPGMWDCKTCNPDGGNMYSFLTQFFLESKRQTTANDYVDIWEKKRIPPAAGRLCGISRNFITGEWIIPTLKKNGDGKIVATNLHRWAESINKLFGTDTMPTTLIGLELLSQTAKPGETVTPKPLIVGEGHWDRPILEHLYRASGDRDTVDILAVPGAGSFKQEWLTYFHKRPSVTFIFDNDWPKTNPTTGKVRQAGLDGIIRIVEMILAMDDEVRPEEVFYLNWPDGLDDGYDVRDLYMDYRKPRERLPVCLQP